MDFQKDPDERVFGLINPLFNGAIEAIGVLDLDDPSRLVGVFYSWGVRGYGKEFIHDVTGMFGEACFSTLGRKLPPGLVCNMHLAKPFLRELTTGFPDFHKIKLHLLEIRAFRPKPHLILYFDTARRYWAYKAIIPEAMKNPPPVAAKMRV